MMVFEQAMKLPIGERESLVSRLMQANAAELTEVELAAHDEAWAPEIRRRVAELESGHMQTVPWSEVRGDHEYSAGHVLTRLIEKT